MATAKKEEAKGTDVEEVKGGALAVAPISFEDDAGAGQEGADSKSYAIPFIIILQANSPQCETVEGAKPGRFLNTITNEVFDELTFIPCAFQRRFVRWAPRSSGGGYKGELNPIDVETGNVPGLSEHEGRFLMDVPDGVTSVFDKEGKALYDQLSDTRNHFILFYSNGIWQRALISMGSTQIKRSKRLMGRIQSIQLINGKGIAYNPASYSHIYHAKSEKETNAKGSWFSFAINMDRIVSDPAVYAMAKEFHANIVAGKVEVAQPVNEEVVVDDGGKF